MLFRSLGERLGALVDDAVLRATMARAGLEVVRAQKGATARTLEALKARCLPAPPPREAAARLPLAAARSPITEPSG